MYRRHGQKLGLVFLVGDLCVTTAAWFAAYVLRFELWPSPGGIPSLSLVAQGLPTLLVTAVIAYRMCGLYEVHRLRELPRELGVVFQASGLLFLLSITLVFYRRDVYESRLALAMFCVANGAGLAVTRRLIWQGLKQLRARGLNHSRAIIVGSGRTARLAAAAIHTNSWTGLESVGYVDAQPGVERGWLKRLGGIDDLPEVIRRHDIDHVFVALPLSRYGELPRIQEALGDVLVEVQLVPDVANMAAMRLEATEVDDLAFLSLRANPHYGWRRLAKRGMDLVIGSAALVAFTPLMLVLATLVKLTSRGPVLYRQPRAGEGGHTFEMLKFRSMRVDAEAETGAVWAKPNDDRCTSIGQFMRRWSLDELPQLFNVLQGHMSLVGPRPERGPLIEKFRLQIPNYVQRHLVKAGMTGWAQVNGWRGNTSLRRRVECDLYYISNWSLWLDLKILALTFWRGFRHPNAY